MEVERLTDEELEVYSRQLVLDEIDFKGQLELKRSRVLVVGLGGLGCPISLQLAAMGVGHLKIVDRDIVSVSDLHRQYLYDTHSVGLPKVEVATSRLSVLNPRIKVEPIPVSIKPWNVEDLLKDVDIVIDGLDSVETRYLINRACVEHSIPYVYGAAVETQGNVSTIMPKRTACLECFSPNLTDDSLPKCAVVGVYTPILGIVASIEVSEAVRLLIGKEPMLAGKLFYVDASTLFFEEVTLARYRGCPVCGDIAKKPPIPLKQKLIEEQCARSGKRTIVITPKNWLKVELDMAIDSLGRLGYTVDKQGKLGVTLTDTKGTVLSILETGVAVFQFPPRKDSANIHSEAATLYRELLADRLGVPEEALPL